jgi:hypothetical protein
MTLNVKYWAIFAIIASVITPSFAVSAHDTNYKRNKNGGYEYTGGAHIKGCSNKFEIGSSTKKFVVDCMKIDSIAVRHPEQIRQHYSQYGTTEIYVYGATTFYFKNNILDHIVNVR